MKQKRTTADSKNRQIPIRVTLLTLDNHLSSAASRASELLQQDLPGLSLSMHAAADWTDDQVAAEKCIADVERADIIIVTMLFMDDHIKPVLPALQARRDHCDAIVCCMSAPEVIKLTRIGKMSMDKKQTGPMALLKRMRGSSKKNKSSAGAQQLSVLKMLPRILKFIPGTAQDLRAYLMVLQYWLAGSEENFKRMVHFLIHRYADGPRSALREVSESLSPVDYPDLGVYHPQMKQKLSESSSDLPKRDKSAIGTVGVIIMRSYVLAGNTAHYDAVIDSLEKRGLNVITAFATGLDARPVAKKFFLHDGRPIIDAVVSLTGFSLVGGPAYNDARAAEKLLAELDVPYLVATPVELQTLDQWQQSNSGLLPVEATMMVAIPELDGATGPIIFGGRTSEAGVASRDICAHQERVERLCSRVEKLVITKVSERRNRKVAMVLFNFPPNAGNAGTAAHLAVFSSLFNTLSAMKAEGYTVELPKDVDTLRKAIVEGNAGQYGTHGNVHTAIDVNDYVRQEPWLDEIESQWGAAPGKHQTDGKSLFVLGAQFGNVFVGLQPGMGYEGDPMRLLFENSFAPTHAFSAFYSFIREQFKADAVLHFGTHGALEFMPGKQVGLSGQCWPDRLIGDVPNFYLYASNNPSEGMIAKRRSAATLVSYMTPPVTQAELYCDLAGLKDTIDRWRQQHDAPSVKLDEIAEDIYHQSVALELTTEQNTWTHQDVAKIEAVRIALIELEETLIPHGLHVVGEIPSESERKDLLLAVASATFDIELDAGPLQAIMAGEAYTDNANNESENQIDQIAWDTLLDVHRNLCADSEIEGLIKALDCSFIAPAPGGDLLRNPDVLPTGRNIHGFDPFQIPSQYAIRDGAQQAELVLQRHIEQGNDLPESVALVLWGTDTLKTEGSSIAQALSLMGARPHLDSYGRVSGATLIPLEELGRPRIDVVMTLSGIFRDLLPIQTKLLAETAYLASAADEPIEQNFVRKHTLAYQQERNCDFETAALRVFSNAEGAYGSNVNMLVDSGRWEDEDELAEVYSQRKSFAYGRDGKASSNKDLLDKMLSGVDFAYQNLDSVELGVTTVDHYFDTLGGISRMVQRSTGVDVPVYISDQTTGEGKVRTLSEQLSLETRTRVLNPKWYEGILQHGYEGVQQIETHITNTVGWSATTGQVKPWMYQKLSETFVLDKEMRERLAQLNPAASVKVAQRLMEACERKYWNPDEETLNALRRAGDDLEDRLEGINQEEAA